MRRQQSTTCRKIAYSSKWCRSKSHHVTAHSRNYTRRSPACVVSMAGATHTEPRQPTTHRNRHARKCTTYPLRLRSCRRCTRSIPRRRPCVALRSPFPCPGNKWRPSRCPACLRKTRLPRLLFSRDSNPKKRPTPAPIPAREPTSCAPGNLAANDRGAVAQRLFVLA